MCLRMGTRKESDHCTWRPNSVSPSICSKKTNDENLRILQVALEWIINV